MTNIVEFVMINWLLINFSFTLFYLYQVLCTGENYFVMTDFQFKALLMDSTEATKSFQCLNSLMTAGQHPLYLCWVSLWDADYRKFVGLLLTVWDRSSTSVIFLNFKTNEKIYVGFIKLGFTSIDTSITRATRWSKITEICMYLSMPNYWQYW